MDTAGHLSSGVKPRNCLAVGSDARGIHIDLETTHAVVDYRRDDGHVEGLALHRGPWDDVVVELLPAARLAAGLVPGLAAGVRGPRAAVGVLLRLLGGLVVRFVRLF